MAATKFGKESFEYLFFRDLWKTFEALGDPDVGNEKSETDYWHYVVYVADKLVEKYKNHPFAAAVTAALVKELERRWKEKKGAVNADS